MKESPDLLDDGAEAAAAVFTAEPGETSAEAGLFTNLHGLYWLTANLAAREPLVLLADDLHWADTASLRWLVYPRGACRGSAGLARLLHAPG